MPKTWHTCEDSEVRWEHTKNPYLVWPGKGGKVIHTRWMLQSFSIAKVLDLCLS